MKVWRLKILPLLWLSTQHLGQTTIVVTATPIISLLIEAEVGAITTEVEEEAPPNQFSQYSIKVLEQDQKDLPVKYVAKLAI